MRSTSAFRDVLSSGAGLAVAAAVLVYILGTAGCGASAGAAGSASPGPATGQGKDVALQVVRPDGTARGVSLKELDSLGKGRILVDGKWEEGPTLPEVLRFAGVTEFQRVTVIGSEVPPVTLTRDQVTSEVVLDFTNHGTVKFSSPSVPKKDWVKDVTTIKVE